MQLIPWFFGALMLAASLAANAASCMVVGEKTARVQTKEGEKSPVFYTQACEALRLVSGSATVSWVSRDGKTHFVPVTSKGLGQVPSAGADERPGNTVWAELTAKREATRPAFMRAAAIDPPTKVYVPAAGLALPARAGFDLRILEVKGDVERLILESKSDSTPLIALSPKLIQPATMYVLEWRKGETLEKWRWSVVSAPEAERVEAQIKEIDAALTDLEQRKIVTAMLFEQFRLRVNMHLVMPEAL